MHAAFAYVYQWWTALVLHLGFAGNRRGLTHCLTRLNGGGRGSPEALEIYRPLFWTDRVLNVTTSNALAMKVCPIPVRYTACISCTFAVSQVAADDVPSLPAKCLWSGLAASIYHPRGDRATPWALMCRVGSSSPDIIERAVQATTRCQCQYYHGYFDNMGETTWPDFLDLSSP